MSNAESGAKIEREIEVGEDLGFQRRWWRFEHAIWWVFVALIALDLAGAFGRGPLAMAAAKTADTSLEIHYERIERSGTPSLMTITLNKVPRDQSAVELLVSDSAVKELGLQRVIPAPQITTVGAGGLLYRFPNGELPATVRLEFEPVEVGFHQIYVRVPGEGQQISMKIFVVP